MRGGGQGLAAALLLTALACAASAQSEPTIDAIAPDYVTAFQPFELTISGSGFAEGAAVCVLTREGRRGQPARYMRYEPDQVEAHSIVISFSFGFGLRPRQRTVFVQNPDGAKSNGVTLSFLTAVEAAARAEQEAQAQEPTDQGAAAETAPEQQPEQGDEEATAAEDNVDPAEAPADEPEAAAVRIDTIQPDAVAPGQRFSLLIMGSGFQRGAEVLIEANANAGTYRQPLYRFLPFEAEFLDETMLEVVFDKGFYHEPERRTVKVRNPDGSESNAVELAVRMDTRGIR